jgi:hypothetical protein
MSLVKTYVAGRRTGAIPEIIYSTDLGVTWNTTNFNASASVISGIVVRQDDPNFIIATNTYNVGDTNNQGIQYSIDGGLNWTQSGGSWLTTIASNANMAGKGVLVIDPDTTNSNVFTIAANYSVPIIRLLKSTDNGFTFSAITTSNAIYGSGNYEIPALAVWDNKVFAAVGAGTGPNPTRVYKSTDYGSTFSVLGAAGASNNIGALYYDQPNDVLYAVALDGVYSSTAGGAFVSEYSFINPHLTVGSIKVINYSDGLLYFNDRTTTYSSDTNFSTITNIYATGAGNTQDFEFYLAGKGFVIANGVDILYTPDNGGNISNTNTDVDFGPDLVTISAIVGCGCEPGFSWDETSQQCIANTPMCPEGMIYNPDLGWCEGTIPGCDTDVVLAIDISGSISDVEMPEYKNMLRGIVDGLEMGYDINGNLNTLANSLGRITSGEIRVGIVLFAMDPSTPLGGVSLAYGPTAWEAGGANNSPAGTVANPGSIKAAINSMGSPIFGAPVDSYGITNTAGVLQTNSYAGLGRAYDLAFGFNSRPTANKKILFVTDGWPNYIDPNALLSDYDIPLPSIITTYGTTPGLPGCGTYGLNDINSVMQSTYQERRLADYIATMDLAQGIKSGAALTSTGASGGATAITLLITGQTLEQNITRAAFVGIDPTDSVTPCYLDTSSIFGIGYDTNKDNAGLDVSFIINPGECPSWQGSYTASDKFPSNAVSGLPDYFQVDLIPSSYANIGSFIAPSLICTTTASPINCQNPCQIIQDPTTAVYYCNCTSSVPFNTCCYDLINCADNTVYASVNTTGQNNDFMAQFIGQYIFIQGVAACLYVSLNAGCTSSTTLDITVDQITAYVDCISCNEVVEVTPYYNLIRCGETTPLLQTTTDLSSYLIGGTNQNLPILTFVEYPDVCFTVEETFTFLPQVVVTVDVAYNDCTTCLSYLC